MNIPNQVKVKVKVHMPHMLNWTTCNLIFATDHVFVRAKFVGCIRGMRN